LNRDDRGQATVEFVLCLPFVLLLAAILVEITLVGADRARVWQAAREAARVAVVDADAAAASRAAARVAPGPLEVEIDPPPHLRRQGDRLSAVVVHRRDGSIPLVGRLFDGIELRAEATMRIEVP
jgi:hypothetical protein